MLDPDVDKLNKAQIAIVLAFKENAIEVDHSAIAALAAVLVTNCVRMGLDPYEVISEITTNLVENIKAGAKYVSTKIDQVQ